MTSVLSAVAWPYANGPRHIGHVSGFGVPSDVFSRYLRMAGHDVLMVSGTDEHGTPILVQAEREGVSPRELADRYNRIIVEDLQGLGLSYDLFTRTTTRNHYAVAQELFKTVYRNGFLVARTTKGAISPSTGRTLPDRYIEGTCPICGYDGARGDQCDNCGNQLDPVDLINPRSRINGETPRFVETQHFFLDLPALADALGEWLKSRTDWRPNVLKFSLNLLDDLRPRAMTRDIDWGIPVPLPGWEDNPAKRLYVWFDAVIGYLSASIEWARRSGDPEAWRKWWGNPAGEAEARSYYFMGKDNITFHSQIWPAELLAYNGEGARGGSPGPLGRLALPTEVVSSEYLMMEGRRFSTSRSVVIYVRDFLSRYDADALRYFIAVAGPENQDTDFTWAEFLRRNNDELVAGWGNLVNRSISMAAKNFGAIPPAASLTEADRVLLADVRAAFDTVGGLIGRHRQKAAIGEALRVVAEVNKYFSESAPWKCKDDPERMGTILHVALQAVSDLNTVLTPFLPHSAQKVYELLGGKGVHAPMPQIREVSDLDGGPDYPILAGDYTVGARWESVPLAVGTPLEPPTPVFRKLDPSIVDEELARLES
jgi:methionyl-tRNA synthetase